MDLHFKIWPRSRKSLTGFLLDAGNSQYGFQIAIPVAHDVTKDDFASNTYFPSHSRAQEMAPSRPPPHVSCCISCWRHRKNHGVRASNCNPACPSILSNMGMCQKVDGIAPVCHAHVSLPSWRHWWHGVNLSKSLLNHNTHVICREVRRSSNGLSRVCSPKSSDEDSKSQRVD